MKMNRCGTRLNDNENEEAQDEGDDAEIDAEDLSEEQVRDLIGDDLYDEIQSIPEVDDSEVDMFTEVAFTLECVYMPSFDDVINETESDSSTGTDSQTESVDDL